MKSNFLFCTIVLILSFFSSFATAIPIENPPIDSIKPKDQDPKSLLPPNIKEDVELTSGNDGVAEAQGFGYHF